MSDPKVGKPDVEFRTFTTVGELLWCHCSPFYGSLTQWLYAEYIMRNAGLEETQAGIKIAGRNINNLRYADDTTLMAESEEELRKPLGEIERGE